MYQFIIELEEELKNELQEIKKNLFIDKSIGILEVVRSVDDIFNFISIPDSDEYYFYFKTHLNGFYEVYEQLCYYEEELKNAYILFKSTENTRAWANEKLQKSGSIGYIYRYLQLAKDNIFSIQKRNNNKILVSINIASSGSEVLEAYMQKNYLYNKTYLSLKHPRIKELEPYVESELPKKVSIKNKHFIKYNTNSLIDEYYNLEADALILAQVGYNAFPNNATFNGIEFQSIYRVLHWLIAATSKHVAFCNAAISKYGVKKINQWDFLSTVYETKKLVKEISSSTKLNKGHVEWIVNALTLSSENIECHLGAPGSSLPIFIKLDQKWILRSVAGILGNPFTYVLRFLRHFYHQDCSKAAQGREDLFRSELYSLIKTPDILKYEKRNIIRKNGKAITDIDAMLYDTRENLLVLIQLKWMDDFGTSMKQRKSMATNFENSIKEWLNGVRSYLKENGQEILLQKFGIKNTGQKIKKPKLLIVGRHFSHFSDFDIDKKATYCSWPFLCAMVNGDIKSLQNLIYKIRRKSIKKKNLNIIIPDQVFNIGNKEYTITFKKTL